MQENRQNEQLMLTCSKPVFSTLMHPKVEKFMQAPFKKMKLDMKRIKQEICVAWEL